MKKIIFLLIIILGAATGHAQKLELGLHGGAGYNTMPIAQSGDSILPLSIKFPVNYSVSLKAITNIGRWQAGLGMDFQKMTYVGEKTKYVFANPATSVYLIGSRKLGDYFYFGLDFGLFFASSANYSVFADNSRIPTTVYMEPGNGFTGGAHLGFSYPLSDRLDLNMETSHRFTSYGIEYVRTNAAGVVTRGNDKYSYAYGNVLVGIRLKMFNDPFDQWLPYKRVR